MSIGPWTFTGFDLVVLLIVFISLVMAGSRGLFRELISISALVVALVASLFVWGRFRFAMQDMVQPKQLADIVLGAGTFALTYMLVVFLLSGVTKRLRGKSVKFIDRITGAGFGMLRGLMVMSLFVMYWSADYREAQAVQTISATQRAQLENMPQEIQDMVNLNRKVELPVLFKDSTFYPLLEKIGSGIRALPFAQFKSMGEKLKDGEDLSDIVKDLN
jgi:membrane protein required for colicin V production